MKIVVLDGFTLNPGDISWAELEKIGDVTVYERTPLQSVVERSGDADIILTNKTPLRAEALAQLPRLRYIGVLATGYDVVDVKAAEEQGILVSNVPGYGTDSVAQMVFALLLELCHRVQRHSDAVKVGKWSENPDFCFWQSPQVELAGKTLGILGYGSIGRRVAEIALAFGMNIAVYSRSQREDELTSKHAADGRFRWAGLHELLETSDVLSLHCPLTPETIEIINEESLSRMKKSAFLINTSRGKLIANAALANALNTGIIAGAALDVLPIEPPPAADPLFSTHNCLITPHIAWASREARERLLDTAVENLAAFLNGSPVRIVNK